MNDEGQVCGHISGLVLAALFRRALMNFARIVLIKMSVFKTVEATRFSIRRSDLFRHY